ncbi:MAG: type II toxin-antitoxin system VapC family toxin [Roseiflexaceae bacterium]
MADLLVDTDILIDAARKVQDAIDYLSNHAQQFVLGISSITHLELLIGCRNKIEQRKVERFLRRFQVIKVSEPITDRAVDLIRHYRLSHGLLLADAFIAATSLVHNLPLASKNQRDYRFIAGLQLLPYP